MASPDLESLPIIGEKQVAGLLKWQPLIDAMEIALREFSAGEVAQPVRQIVPVPGHDAIIAAMPAVGTAMAVKIVTLYHSNTGTDLPIRFRWNRNYGRCRSKTRLRSMAVSTRKALTPKQDRKLIRKVGLVNPRYRRRLHWAQCRRSAPRNLMAASNRQTSGCRVI